MSKQKSLVQCFIGKRITIAESTSKELVGIEGKIIDETKEMFTLDTKKGTKKIVKNQITFTTDNGRRIEGKNIRKTIENRMKLRIKNE